MRLPRTTRIAALVASVLVLTACGGADTGGGDAPSVADKPSFAAGSTRQQPDAAYSFIGTAPDRL